MKTILFFLLCGITFCVPFKNKPVTSETTEPGQTAGTEAMVYPANMGDSFATEAEKVSEPAFAKATAGKADTISFTMQIQPILQSRCNPCHFPGGKMYEKMPFDQAKTILDHPEGILKRFTDEADNKLFRQFLAEAGN